MAGSARMEMSRRYSSEVDVSDCTAKHTKYDPSIDEWKCPECGAESGQFCIDDGPDLDCEMLHDDDEIRCYACKYETTGARFAALIARRKNLVTCPHCKGKGMVPKAKE